MSESKTTQISLRLDNETLKQAEMIAESMSKRIGCKEIIGRSAVLRAAVTIGLGVLESKEKELKE